MYRAQRHGAITAEHQALFLILPARLPNLDPQVVFSNNNVFKSLQSRKKVTPERTGLSRCVRLQPRAETEISAPRATFDLCSSHSLFCLVFSNHRSSLYHPNPHPPATLCFLSFEIVNPMGLSFLMVMNTVLHIKQRSVCVSVSAWKMESRQITEKGQCERVQQSGLTPCQQCAPSVGTNTQDQASANDASITQSILSVTEGSFCARHSRKGLCSTVD